VVVPDHIGCGLSDKPSPREYPYRLERRVEDLKQLVERLDLRDVTLVGHDWGGAIGLGAAVKMPERFSRLVLMNTAAFPSSRCPWRIRVCRTPLLGQLGLQGLNLFSRAALRMATARPGELKQEARAGLLIRTTRGRTGRPCTSSCATSPCGRAIRATESSVRLKRD